MRRDAGFALAQAAAYGLLATGTLGALFPRTLSKAFGVTVYAPEALAFVRAAAVRDITIGTIVLDAVLHRRRKALMLAAAACTALSASDLANAYFTGGRVARAEHLLHAGGGGLFVAVLALLAT